jgi:hypothetical protein
MALDEFNEYIVREVKEMIANNVTPATDDHLRNTLSLLVTMMWDARRKVADETDAHIFDYHSSRVDNWCDVKIVADAILKSGILPGGAPVADEETQPLAAQDLFMDGLFKLSTTAPIEKLKRNWAEENADVDELSSEVNEEDIEDDENEGGGEMC